MYICVIQGNGRSHLISCQIFIWKINFISSYVWTSTWHTLLFLTLGFVYWTRWNSINETVVWRAENCCSIDTNICHTAMWPCSILSFWWDWRCTGSSVQDCCWKYPVFIYCAPSLSLSLSKTHTHAHGINAHTCVDACARARKHAPYKPLNTGLHEHHGFTRVLFLIITLLLFVLPVNRWINRVDILCPLFKVFELNAI